MGPMTKNPAVLRGRAEEARERLRRCDVCPRMCGAHRLEERVGTCRIGSRAVVSSAFAHFGEEEPLVGFHGSGTIFFAGCNLHCAFCQNFDISHSRTGRKVTGEQLGTMMLGLQESGCHNINLVTPSHVVPQILDGLANAVERGLRIPIVYNSSGYDDAGMLRALEGAIDIYMPDFKVWEPRAAKRYLSAEDYPAVARKAVLEMHRQVGDLVIDQDGLAVRGLLVPPSRHAKRRRREPADLPVSRAARLPRDLRQRDEPIPALGIRRPLRTHRDGA